MDFHYSVWSLSNIQFLVPLYLFSKLNPFAPDIPSLSLSFEHDSSNSEI